jgi:ribosome-associated protein
MNTELLERLRLAAAALDEKKAFHVLALDVASRSSIAEAFVICSVGSTRQAQAVANEVGRRVSRQGGKVRAVEGYQQGGWILMDFGDFILHIFVEERREYYALERLWGDAPVITQLLLPPDR